MKIGILVTNTDNSAYAQSQPRDGEKFTRLIHSVRSDWKCLVYLCPDGQFPSDLHECDAYIIGGSPASVNDNALWIAQLFEVIRKLHQQEIPIVGCCFGHQAIAKALGGAVNDNPGSMIFGVSETIFTHSMKWMQPKHRSLALFAAHGEQVSKLPVDARIIGEGTACPVGSFVIGNHIMTTEYHPEMTKDFFMGLTYAFENEVGSGIAAEARRQGQTETDGPIFAEWMARFFEGAVAKQVN